MMPKEFFVTKGKAFSPTSELNAFDQALKNAGIAHCNLVSVSSILPKGCIQRDKVNIPPGSITYAVIARMDGIEGQNIGVAISWSWERNGHYGIVAETHGYMDEAALLEIAEWKILEMARIRDIKVGEIHHVCETSRVPMDNYGCVIAALVFCP
jgi:pyruvoyl-dependent arginine decarboxylase